MLDEGPESPIPGNEGARLKMFPTVTLKGCVFIWMGQREPAPLEEDIPPEFFMEHSQLQYSVTNWTCNWRQAVENILDAHPFYVHKDSLRFFRMPADLMIKNKLGPTRARPEVINGKVLSFPAGQAGTRPENSPYRDPYPGLSGQVWPKHEAVRMNWAKVMTKTLRFRLNTDVDPRWKSGGWSSFHLPGMYRSFGQGKYVYTRHVVPISPDLSRIFYFYTTYGRSDLERMVNRIWFTWANNWFKNYNFFGQDQAVMKPQVYDRPEALSATDVFPFGIRRLVIERARDFQNTKPGD